MCGRYCAADDKEIRPGDAALVHTARGAEEMRFGIACRQNRLIINARSETASDKPLFREAMRSRRAVIEASSFFEWDALKRCHRFTAPDRQKIYLAALYLLSQSGQKHFVILTQSAQGNAQRIHHRTPCFLPSEEYRYLWLHHDDLAPALLREPQALHIARVLRSMEQTSLFAE